MSWQIWLANWQRIEEVGKYIEATIAEIDDHTENMEKLFKMDRQEQGQLVV